MPHNPFEQNCPCCGSKNLKLSKLGAYKHTFIPEERNSAVSRICNPRRVVLDQRRAECNSGAQQIEDLRYRKSSRLTPILADTPSLGGLRYERGSKSRGL